MKIKRALLSVFDKEGIVDLARFLSEREVELIASGGTAKILREAGLTVTGVEKITGNPPSFAGRMKTLSFQIGASLLFRRGDTSDEKEAAELGISPVDLVVVNCYPFAEVAKRGGDWEELIENIDIGGSFMIRAAAKNCAAVTVLTDPGQYARFRELFVAENGMIPGDARREFAISAFKYSALYEGWVATTLGGNTLRYGENPHQEAKVIAHPWRKNSLAAAAPLQGKELSYNNFLDADAAWRVLSDLYRFKASAAVVVKHLNPCGAAVDRDLLSALRRAWASDPISAFGSIISLNGEVTAKEAEWLAERFVEIIIAPSFTREAQDIFANKKSLRLIELSPHQGEYRYRMVRSIHGGLLVQEEDRLGDCSWESVTTKAIPDTKKSVVQFGIAISKHLRSNAIVLVREEAGALQVIGAGMGNPNRLASIKDACLKAKENGIEDLSEAVLVSDAFFPFKDSIEYIDKHGIKFVVQPGGSVRDEQVIACSNEREMAMAFTGRRHFRH